MQNSLLARVGEAVWGWPMMALFLGTGIWYMLRLRGLPLRRLGQALRAIFRGGESADGISPYAALCTALAATIGTAISSAWPRRWPRAGRALCCG